MLLSVIMLSVIMLSVIMLSVTILSVFMLNVVAPRPRKPLERDSKFQVYFSKQLSETKYLPEVIFQPEVEVEAEAEVDVDVDAGTKG